MIEDVVEVDSHFEFDLLAEREEFFEPHVDAPGPWAKQLISFRHLRVVKNVCASRWWCKCGSIKDLISGQGSIRISDHQRPERRAAEIADRIDESTRDVAGIHRSAVIADPVRRKSGAALGKHIPR